MGAEGVAVASLSVAMVTSVCNSSLLEELVIVRKTIISRTEDP